MTQLGKFRPWVPQIARGGGGSSGTSYQQTNSNSENGPPTPIAWALNELAGQRYGLYQQNPTAPAYYPGSTVAPFSAQSEAGLGALYNRGITGSGLTAAGKSNALATLQGDYLAPQNNPGLQGAISYAQQPVIDAFNNQVLPGINSTFSGAGRANSGLHQATVNQATDTLTRNLAGAATTAGAGAYDAERARQMQALGLAPALANQDYTDLNAVLQAGNARDVKAQQNIDADIAKYNYEQNAQADYQTRVAQQLQSIYPGGSSTGQSTMQGTMQQPGMGTGGWLGAGLSSAGLGLQLANGLGWLGGAGAAGSAGASSLGGLASLAMISSDRNDKTDVQELGIDPLTGRKLYSYRYRGDPKSYPKVVGPMAQDIERTDPGRVREIGGHKVVAVGGLM